MGLWSDLQNRFKNYQHKEASLPLRKTNELSFEQVSQVLQKITPLGEHEDIFSSGYVTNIDTTKNLVRINMVLPHKLQSQAEKIRLEVIKTLSELHGIAGIQVNIEPPSSQESATLRSSKQKSPSKQRATSAIPDTKASLGRVKHIIAVASGKGGVGKSTTAVNLAYALQAAGSKVGILDADIYGPSIPQMTGVGKPEKMENDLVVPPTAGDVKVISVAMFSSAEKPSPAMLRGPMVAQIIRQFLTQVAWGELDYLIIDYPPGTGDIQLTLSQMAPITGAIVVTTPQEVALIDVRKAASMFQTVNIPILGVLETMSYFLCEGSGKKHYIFGRGGGKRLAEEFGVPLIGTIPLEEDLALGSDQGEPYVKTSNQSSAAAMYIDSASKLAKETELLTSTSKGLDQFSIEWKN